MNVADVLHILIDQAKFAGESVEHTFVSLEAHNAVEAWAQSATLPDGPVPGRPTGVPVAASNVAPAAPTIDYDALAAAIARQQTASLSPAPDSGDQGAGDQGDQGDQGNAGG